MKKEFRDDTHGLVYPVYLDHEEIGRCYGHATILLHLQDGSPWPVRQVADIRLDKDLQTNDCDFLVSTLSDELLPEGTLSISMTYSSISSPLVAVKSIGRGTTSGVPMMERTGLVPQLRGTG